ncbi:hypothetical protein [Aliikangiella coralliicola]|uniref:Uncharacterized protein n=1 Tax=Aliikangiella coralliicola TaxID=2592383 RepID=A0A545UE78_9GAMM|nr:hypothetical protein [Aliikangiella coralliicola]TQV87771.1 hypothetical protein FLL46_10315 [Aliikangiella coralliicola]
MNYFQRLIKRAKAQAAGSQSSLFDPFAKTAHDPVQWPQSQSVTKEVDNKKMASPLSPVQTDEAKVQTQKKTTEYQSETHLTEVKENHKTVVPAQDVSDIQSDKKLTPQPEENNPNILNKTPGIAIIDQIMEPYIESFKAVDKKAKPEEKKSVKPPQKVNKKTEPNNNTEHIQTQKKKAVTADNVIQPITQKLTSKTPQPKKIEADKQALIAEVVEKRIQEVEQKLTQNTQNKKPNAPQEQVVIVNRTTTQTGERKSTGGGSPHIGIGQL